MLFFASGQGRLTVVPAQINQNSNGANTIYLTGAFPSASVVTVAFTLPDGTNTEPQLMTGDKTVEYNGVTLAVKEYTLPKSITQVYGRVTAQFYIQNGTEVLTTEATNITVAKGVPSLSAGAAPENIYEQIVAALSSIQTELTNKLDKVSGSTPYDMIYAKTANGEQTMKAATEETVGQTLVERTLAGNVNVNAATEDKHAVNLKQFIDTMSAAIAESVATTEITDIDLTLGDETVLYDTTNGIQLSATGKITRKDGTSEQPQVDLDIPIVAGKNMGATKSGNLVVFTANNQVGVGATLPAGSSPEKIFIKTDENYDAGGTTVDIVQSTGQSTTAVMSQKAVTDAITAAVNSAIATALNTAV